MGDAAPLFVSIHHHHLPRQSHWPTSGIHRGESGSEGRKEQRGQRRRGGLRVDGGRGGNTGTRWNTGACAIRPFFAIRYRFCPSAGRLHSPCFTVAHIHSPPSPSDGRNYGLLGTPSIETIRSKAQGWYSGYPLVYLPLVCSFIPLLNHTDCVTQQHRQAYMTLAYVLG